MSLMSTPVLLASSMTASQNWVQRVHTLAPLVLNRWEGYVLPPADSTWFDFVGGLGLGKMVTQIDLLFALRCAHTGFEQGLAYGRWIHAINNEFSPQSNTNKIVANNTRSERHFDLIHNAISVSEGHYDELILKYPDFLEKYVSFSYSNAPLSQLAKGAYLAPTDFACGLLSSWLFAGLCLREKRVFSEFTINAIERFNAHG